MRGSQCMIDYRNVLMDLDEMNPHYEDKIQTRALTQSKTKMTCTLITRKPPRMTPEQI